MSFHKKEAKEIIKQLERTHGSEFKLAAYVPVGGDMSKLTHFSPQAVAVKHKNLSEVFHTFRKKFPFGQYLLIIVCGDDVPEHPPKEQKIRNKLAKMRGKYKPAIEAEVLQLDTNWLDKAFEYQKRLTY